MELRLTFYSLIGDNSLIKALLGTFSEDTRGSAVSVPGQSMVPSANFLPLTLALSLRIIRLRRWIHKGDIPVEPACDVSINLLQLVPQSN